MTTRYNCNGYHTGGHIGSTFDKVAHDMTVAECRIRRALAMLAAVSPTRWIQCGRATWCILDRDGRELAPAWFSGRVACVQYDGRTASAGTMHEAVAQLSVLPPFDAPLNGWQCALGHNGEQHEHHDGRAFWLQGDEWIGEDGDRMEYADTLDDLFEIFGWPDRSEVTL